MLKYYKTNHDTKELERRNGFESDCWIDVVRPTDDEVEEIVEAQWKDLGMPETLWHSHVKEFGPLIVSIDSYGRNYFEEKKVEYNRKKDEQVELISKQVGFIK